MNTKHFRHYLAAQKIATIVAAFLIAALALQLSGCGASQRQTALKTAFISVDAASAAFVEWDAHKQDQIVAGATDFNAGTEQLVLYRLKRERVYTAFVVAYRAIAAASTDKDAPLLGALANVEALYAAIVDLKGPSKPSPLPPADASPAEAVPAPKAVPAPVPAVPESAAP